MNPKQHSLLALTSLRFGPDIESQAILVEGVSNLGNRCKEEIRCVIRESLRDKRWDTRAITISFSIIAPMSLYTSNSYGD